MRAATVGHALLIFAILLNAAGIVEPLSATSAVAAVLAFASLWIGVVSSNNIWASGYEAAQSSFSLKDSQLVPAPTLFKCGEETCSCVNDPRYAVNR